MKKPVTDIGIEIRRLRNELGIALGQRVTQEELGQIMGGYTGRTIYSYENSRSTPSRLFVDHLRDMVKTAKKRPLLKETA